MIILLLYNFLSFPYFAKHTILGCPNCNSSLYLSLNLYSLCQ
uniref:Uncharacterized protein n=1 Tax=Arundo donax TaxID=35708 RepID=A0A0A9AU52_ARUDO